MHDLTGFKRDVLYVLAGTDGMKGLDVIDALESYYGTNINHGRLYPNLDDLTEMGLITKEREDGRTNRYALTRRAGQELEARREWENEQMVSGVKV